MLKVKSISPSGQLGKHCVMKAYGVVASIDPRFIDLTINLKAVAFFTPQPPYPREESPGYLLGRRLGGPKSRSRRREEEKNHVSIETSNSILLTIQPGVSPYTDYALPDPYVHSRIQIMIYIFRTVFQLIYSLVRSCGFSDRIN
jgi:hypothetical protein